LRRHARETGNDAVPTMGEDQRAGVRDRHRKAISFGALIRPGKQYQFDRLGAVPVRLHRRDLYWLGLKWIYARVIADKELQRRHDGGEPDGHVDHGAALLQVVAADEVSCTDGEHHE